MSESKSVGSRTASQSPAGDTAAACPVQMMRCSEFVGVPGSGAVGAQPFRVAVAPAAALAMDFHAHLNMDEVGGLLGGSYDAATATLRCAPRASLREWNTAGRTKQPAL